MSKDTQAVVGVHREFGGETQDIYSCELPAHVNQAKAELAKLGDGDITVVRVDDAPPGMYSCKGCHAEWPEE